MHRNSESVRSQCSRPASQMSAVSVCLRLVVITVCVVSVGTQETTPSLGNSFNQTDLFTVLDGTATSVAASLDPTNVLVTTQTALSSSFPPTSPIPSSSTPLIATRMPTTSPQMDVATTGSTPRTGSGSTASATTSLSTASATSPPVETADAITSPASTSRISSASQTVGDDLSTPSTDTAAEQDSTLVPTKNASTTVAVATTESPNTDMLSIIEWFLVAVAVAAFIFFLYILYHFCQVKRRRTARTHSEQNKNVIEYPTPQSPKEKWRNSWALEAMIYHIELPQETSGEMEAKDNVVFEEDETQTAGNSNHSGPHLTRL